MIRQILAGATVLSMHAVAAASQPLGIDPDPVQPDGETASFEADATPLSINVPSGPGTTALPFIVNRRDEAIYQGDIVLGSGEDLLSVIGGASLHSIGGVESFGVVMRDEARLWPDATMRFVVSPGLSDKSRVFQAVAAWEATGLVHFEQLAAPSGNYVEFMESDVCNSRVGMHGGGRQVINLAPSCRFGSVAHEIAHALGVQHEQTRSDRDQNVVILEENIVPTAMGNFKVAPESNVDTGTYCYDSIMHYRDNAFAVAPGLKTIKTVPVPDVPIGQRERIATCDIEAVSALYGLPMDDPLPPRSRFEGELGFFPDGCQSTRRCFLKNDILYREPTGLVWKAVKRDPSSDSVIQTGLTDGASIPGWARPFIGQPFDEFFILAAVIHDHYCYTENHVRTWRQTHRMFYNALTDLGIPPDKAKVMYFAVYLGGPRWTKLVPGEACGPDCVSDELPAAGAGAEPTLPELFRADRFRDPSFIAKLKGLSDDALAALGALSLEQIEEAADLMSPDDPFNEAGDIYLVQGPDDPIFEEVYWAR